MPVLQGREVWNYGDGRRQYEVTRENGKKIGQEKYFRPDGSPQWTRDYHSDGTMVWTSFWPNGQKKSESHWRGSYAQGETRTWDTEGKLLQTFSFKDGRNVAGNQSSNED
jgi:antitoxin component YwqK of YwqJK toxin-antitoxin module